MAMSGNGESFHHLKSAYLLWHEDDSRTAIQYQVTGIQSLSSLIMRQVLINTLAFRLALAVPTELAERTSPKSRELNVQIGVRPYYLIDNIDAGPLKDKLASCSEMDFKATEFVIGHRGAALQFPEHSRESMMAAVRQGAGVIECDISFTKGKKLVCRHSHCDLHTTTNILQIPELAAKCTKPFNPYDPKTGKVASVSCCKTDIILTEFKSLCARMDGTPNPYATSVADFLKTPVFRTDLYVSISVPTSSEY
jgi:glycerophosphoryl diester phosphodiesterase